MDNKQNRYVNVSVKGVKIKRRMNALQSNAAFRYDSVKGTKENEECSNRGICDTLEGVCECFTSNDDIFASSDG